MKPIKEMNLSQLADQIDGKLIGYHLLQFDIADRLRELHEQHRWIPVEERLPERNNNVLVARRNPHHLYEITAFQRDGVFYSNETAKELIGVTHWKRIDKPEATP